MSVVLLEEWTEQPPYWAEANMANPIAAKACAITVPTCGLALRTLAPQGGRFEAIAYPSGTAAVVGLGPSGMAATRSSASTHAFRLHSAANQTDTIWEAPSSAMTMLAVVCRIGNSSGHSVLFGNNEPLVSPYGAWEIIDRSGTGTLRVGCVAGSSQYSVDKTSGFTGADQVIVGRYDGAKLEGFSNGVSFGSVACSGTIAYTNSANRGPSVGNFYNYTGDTRSWNGRVYLAALWPVALSNAEIAALSENPWQLFAP